MSKNLQFNLRKLHRKIAPILFLPLLISALTGIAYRIGRSWFGLSDQFGDFMMIIHEGKYLGKPLAPVYVLLTGLGLAGMLVTGIFMLKQRQNQSKSDKFSTRLLHRFLAPVFFLPLVVSASTGITYRLGKTWFGLSTEQAQLFLDIHQGNYLGSSWRGVYILLVGLGLIFMLVTGMEMTGIFRNNLIKVQAK
ncbi:PepSY domain-containing protein [Merismopedia glauca]|uniref:Peptidase n=1 Tax=Merismopedia glauca CCAP 1448/3 TaxID=1296344 RepID=A0A2T1C827_9CYAN|nr:PepSY domain-containing protein [Merismopedia glauca]PSB04435.1 peptidase [Merismopedia glauca CCAP 1448/3]